MADKAHIATDKELERMERHLSAIYSQAGKEIEETAKKYFEKFAELDEQKKKQLDDGKITEKEYKTWRQNKVLYGKRYTKLKEQIAEQLAHTNETALAYVNGQLPPVYALNYNATGKGIAEEVKGYSFELTDAQTVKTLATAKDIMLPAKKIDIPADMKWNAKKVNSEVLQGILQGDSMDKIAKRMRRVTDMNATSAIRNARTMVTSAENSGRLDGMKKAEADGLELKKEWIATTDSRVRHWHAELDGVQVGIDEPFENEFGKIMFPGDPSADGANVYNCFVGETKIASDCDIVRSYKHEYSGRFVTIKTAGGVCFTCTPNHPILTQSGWVSAESLQNGDNLIVARRRNNVFSRINPDINHSFPSIDTIHESFDVSGGERTISMSVNFHGDIPASDVEIITEKRFLRECRNSGIFNSINKFLLKHTDKPFLRESAFLEHFCRVCKSAFSFISCFGELLSFFFARLGHSEIHRLRAIALLYSGRVKTLNNDVARNAELICECLDGFSGVIFSDNVVSVDFNSGCSHVYNLQTKNGYYFVNSSISQNGRKSNGVFAIAHNCRCTMASVVVGFRKRGKNE